MRLAALLLLAGCDRVLGLSTVSVHADGGTTSDVMLDAWAPPALVQQNGGTNEGSGTLSVALPSTPGMQHVLVAIGGSTSGVVPVPSGGGVSIWAQAGASCQSVGLQIWFGVVDTSSAPVTITYGGVGSDNARLEVTEWAGLSTINPADQYDNAGSSTGSGMIDLAVNTTSASDLLVFGVGGYMAFVSPGSSWLSLPPIGVSPVQDAWYEVASGAGSQTAQTAYNGGYDGVLAAFRAGP